MSYPSTLLNEIADIAKKHGLILDKIYPDEKDKGSLLIKMTEKVKIKKPTIDSLSSDPSDVYLPDGKLNTEYLIANAKILISAAEHDSAVSILKAVICSGRKNSEVCLMLGKCYEALSKDHMAADCYEESIAFAPSLEAYQKLCGLWMKAKDFSQAAKIMDRASTSKISTSLSTQIELLKTAGNCWAKAGQTEIAIQRYQQALHLDPTLDCIQSNLALIQFKLGKATEAKMGFQDALSANPANAKAALGLAYISLREGHRSIAHDYFVKSLNLNIHQPDAIFHLTRLSFELKTFSSAVRLLEEYIEVSPVSANLLYTLGGMQFQLNRRSEAKNTLKRVLEVQPDHVMSAELLKLIQVDESKESSWRTVNHGKNTADQNRAEHRAIE